MIEIVYILENEAMPGIIKIGRTKDLNRRISELSKDTALPFPFHCLYAATVQDAILVERQLHMAFAPQRLRKEFFKMPAHCAISVLELVAIEIVTPRRRAAEDDSNVTPIIPRRSSTAANLYAETEKASVLKALITANRPVSNEELAPIMSVTKGETSRRVTAAVTAGLVKRDRMGRHVQISITAQGVEEAVRLNLVPAERAGSDAASEPSRDIESQ